MKRLFSKLTIVLALGLCTFVSSANAQKPANTPPGIPSNLPFFSEPKDKELASPPYAGTKKMKSEPAQKGNAQNEKSIATSPNVAIVYCGGTGRVAVRGWDKSEVRVVSEKDSKVNLIAVKENGESSPVSQIRVTVVDEDSEETFLGPCFSNSNLDLYVPRGAFLDLKTQEGDISVERVAKARLKSLNGSFSLREISAEVLAETTSGDILINNSSGQITLKAVSGSVDVRNVKPFESGNYLFASSISGDVTLDRVFYWRVEGASVSGNVSLFGSLTKGASYYLRTTTGDMTVAIPANSSFRVNATVSRNGEIISDFPISKPTTTTSTRTTTRLIGTYGTGDAALNLTAINGIIHIRKK